MWMSPDQDRTCRWNQPCPGSAASTIQSDTIAIGTNAMRKNMTASLGHPHFVQPPSSCDSAMTSPAPAISP